MTSARAERTVQLDATAVLAMSLYEQAVQAARPATRSRRAVARHPDAGQRAALIATVQAALRDDVDARALAGLMRRACESDPASPYESMRTALSQAAPQVGYVCPRCGQAIAPGPHARVGVCPLCQAVGSDPARP